MKKRLYILVLCFFLSFFSACSSLKTSNTVTKFTITPEQVEKAMYDAGVDATFDFVVRDSIYSLPARSFISGEFSESLRSFLFDLAAKTWIAQENDCDDFALDADFLMSYLHHQTENKVKNTGIAFGEFYYMKDMGNGVTEGHAINVAIVREGGQLQVIFYEPQSYRIIKLTKEEMQSCDFWRF